MKTVVIPDIHLKTSFATRIINSEGADEVILLGDMFDNHDDTPDENKLAAQWLNNILDDNRVVYLHSNHDCNYIGDNLDNRCKGYTDEKKKAIRSVLRTDIRKKVKYFHISQGALFAHAGLHISHIPVIIRDRGIEIIKEFLDINCAYADRFLYNNCWDNHWFFKAGYCRNGSVPFGGLLWSDFYREFTHVKGITQIMGHTCPINGFSHIPHFRIQGKDKFTEYEQYTTPKIIDGTWSCGLDCHLDYYGVVENGLFKVAKYSDL